MIIVLEGPDLAGKTTIAREYERRGFTYHHQGPLKTSAREAYLEPLRGFTYGFHVLDRWHLGELVYGPMLRGESKVDDALLEEIEVTLDALGARRFIVLPDIAVLRQRYAERGDDLLTLEQVEQVHAFYAGYDDARWKRHA